MQSLLHHGVVDRNRLRGTEAFRVQRDKSEIVTAAHAAALAAIRQQLVLEVAI
jgi:hypothetical protein